MFPCTTKSLTIKIDPSVSSRVTVKRGGEELKAGDELTIEIAAGDSNEPDEYALYETNAGQKPVAFAGSEFLHPAWTWYLKGFKEP